MYCLNALIMESIPCPNEADRAPLVGQTHESRQTLSQTRCYQIRYHYKYESCDDQIAYMYKPLNMHTACFVLLANIITFVVLIYIPIFVKLDSSALNQSYDCPGVSEAPLGNIGKLFVKKIHQNTRAKRVHKFWGVLGQDAALRMENVEILRFHDCLVSIMECPFSGRRLL